MTQTKKTTPPSETGGIRGFRSPYDGHRVRVIADPGTSVTRQAFKDECDINNIVRKFAETGEMPTLNQVEPKYMDVGEIDFTDLQQKAAIARTLWEELPEAYRQERYNGSLEAFLENPYPEDTQETATQEAAQEPERAKTAGSEGTNEPPETAKPIDPT